MLIMSRHTPPLEHLPSSWAAQGQHQEGVIGHSGRLLPPTWASGTCQNKRPLFKWAACRCSPPSLGPDPRPTAASQEARDSVQLLQTMMEYFHAQTRPQARHRHGRHRQSRSPASRSVRGLSMMIFNFPPHFMALAMTSLSGIKNKYISQDPRVRRLNEANCGFVFSIFRTRCLGGTLAAAEKSGCSVPALLLLPSLQPPCAPGAGVARGVPRVLKPAACRPAGTDC